MRTLSKFVGLLAFALGLVWIGQGMGYVDWPKSSVMTGQMQWAYYGAGLAVAGLLILIAARRRRDMRARMR